MRLLMYHTHGDIYVGIKTDEGVIRTSVKASYFFKEGWQAYQQLRQTTLDISAYAQEEELNLAPVVPAPGKIICADLNYRKHVAESGMDEPAYPLLFSKFNNAIAGNGEAVPMATDWHRVDYEAELLAVIGKEAKNVSVEDALDYVLGYCNGNDISERALQFRSGQWLLGKTPDNFLPIGPYLVTADSVPDPQNLTIRGWLNGELRQESNTSDMIFSLAELISYVSEYMTLYPGDIIATGTPEGVILGYPEEKRQWMKPGDEYTVEIEGLGTLSNTMIEA